MSLRPMTGDMVAALEGEVLYPAFLFDATFRDGVIHLWTGRGPLTWNGNTYTGIGWIVGFSSIEETTDIQANGITVTLGGLDPEVISIALQQVQKNKPGTIWFAPRDPATGGIIGDPEIAYSGVLDISTVTKKAGAAAVVINYEGRLKNLNIAKVRRFTDADQKIDYPNDRFFEYVGTIQDQVLTWGGGGNG